MRATVHRSAVNKEWRWCKGIVWGRMGVEWLAITVWYPVDHVGSIMVFPTTMAIIVSAATTEILYVLPLVVVWVTVPE